MVHPIPTSWDGFFITSTMHCIFLGTRVRKGGPELVTVDCLIKGDDGGVSDWQPTHAQWQSRERGLNNEDVLGTGEHGKWGTGELGFLGHGFAPSYFELLWVMLNCVRFVELCELLSITVDVHRCWCALNVLEKKFVRKNLTQMRIESHTIRKSKSGRLTMRHIVW